MDEWEEYYLYYKSLGGDHILAVQYADRVILKLTDPPPKEIECSPF